MDVIARAFASSDSLEMRIRDAQATTPSLCGLFDDIARFVEEKTHQPTSSGSQLPKKRKLDDVPNGVHCNNEKASWGSGAVATVNDVSFSVPVRKKLRLEIGSQQSQGVRATNSQTGEQEVATRWQELEQIVCLPVPEKVQPQYNFCIFPRGGTGIGSSGGSEGAGQEQVVWTVPATAPKPGICNGDIRTTENESYKEVVLQAINARLSKYRKDLQQVTEPSAQEFASELAHAHRKGEKAYHVKAFRGSKDGFLFFLSTGIVWGFKKPLAFFAFDTIESISYTSVLQRTFNLNITTCTSDTDSQEIEFSMIDQADFAGIDAYIKRHELQDASMAEQRRAKKYNVNKVKGQETEEDGDGQPGELEKAEKEAEQAQIAQPDEEDEEDDENFDPGSEGESEGSGSSSEEDDDQQMDDANEEEAG